MAGITLRTARQVVPMIYAYTTPEIARHNGWTKIGYTEQPVDKRLKQQTHTAARLIAVSFPKSGNIQATRFITPMRSNATRNDTPGQQPSASRADVQPANCRFRNSRYSSSAAGAG